MALLGVTLSDSDFCISLYLPSVLVYKRSMACKADWEDDENLKQDLAMYVRQGLKRDEIINFLNRDYSCYKWSIRTLDRRLRYFDIY